MTTLALFIIAGILVVIVLALLEITEAIKGLRK